MNTRTASLASALAVAAVLFLGGCAFLPPGPSFDPDRGSSSDDSSGSDTSSDDDNSDEDSSDDGDSDSDIEDNPFLEHEVPDTFPSEVPLPDLDVVFALDLGTGWSVVFGTDDLEGDFEDVVELYEGDGWEVLSQAASDGTVFAVFNNDDYQVQLSGTEDESPDYDGPVLAFTVIAKD